MRALIDADVKEGIFKVERAPSIFLKSFLVRQAYEHLYEKISNNKDVRVFLVIGNPGIGKTVFLQYVLMKVLKKKSNVLYVKKSQNLSIYFDIFENKATAYFGKRIPAVQEGFSDDDNMLLLIDAASTQSQTLSVGNFRAIVASSPNVSNYKEFEKDYKLKKYYMPVWSYDELEKASSIEKNSHLTDMKKRFEKFGGIPRIIFESSYDRYRYHCSMQIHRIETCKMDVISCVGSSEDDGSVTHMILQQHVAPSYESFTMEFVSDSVRSAVLLYAAENQRTNLMSWANSTNSLFSLFVFQAITNHQLARGASFDSRKILSMDDQMSLLSLEESQDNQCYQVELSYGESFKLICPFTDVDDLKTLLDKGEEYLVAENPADKPYFNLSAIVPPRTLFVITNEEKLKLLGHSVVNLCTVMKEVFTNEDKFKCYFVVRRDHFKSFKFQFVTTVNAADIKAPLALKEVEFRVLTQCT